MNYLLVAAVVGLTVSGASLAQTQTAPNSPNPPAIAHGDGNTTSAAGPVAGKNSFTENEATERLEKRGYSDVSALHKDDQSIWRGTATKDGKSVSVAVDYQGNVFGQ